MTNKERVTTFPQAFSFCSLCRKLWLVRMSLQRKEEVTRLQQIKGIGLKLVKILYERVPNFRYHPIEKILVVKQDIFLLTVVSCQVLIIWWRGSNRTLFLVPDFYCLICLDYSKLLCNVSCAMLGPCFKDGYIVIYIRDGERIGQRRMKGATGIWRNPQWFSHLCIKFVLWPNPLLQVYIL